MDYMLARLSTEQDYFWFVALLLWGGAAVLWWREARALPAWRWLPWSAVSGGLLAIIEIVAFAIPVRSVPGVPPHFLTERLLSAAAALGLIGWIWELGNVRSWLRLVAIAGVVALVGQGWSEPRTSAAGLALAVIAVGVSSWPQLKPDARRAMAFVMATFWISSWGTGADFLAMSRRWHTISAGSIFWSGMQGCAAAFALAMLYRAARPSWLSGATRANWRGFFWAAAGWLVAGLILAGIAGQMARLSFEMGAVARAKVAAALIDPAPLVQLLQPAFKVVERTDYIQPTGQTTPLAVVPWLDTPVGWKVRQAVAKIGAANPDVDRVHLVVARGGYMMLIPSAQRKTQADRVAIIEPTPGYAWEEWSYRDGFYQVPAFSTYGISTQARAPIFDDSGRKLGWIWLQFSVGSWGASQAQARLLVFAIVAAGLGIALLIVVHRVRTQEREEARAEALVAARADHLKTTFLAKVSHELRTPIQSILGYGELLRSAISDPVARSRLEAQRQHGELMLRLVNDLLDLSAIQAGAFRLCPKPTPLIELVQQAAESLAPRAQAKGIAFSFVAEAEVPRWVIVDRERVRQVVLNLVSNAVKFTDRGRIEVALSRGSAAESIVLTVSDTGPGIAPHERASLFQPFSRLDATAAKEGTGLGLALAAAFCRSMGGDISVQSAPGEGACFEAQLMARSCEAPPTTEGNVGVEPGNAEGIKSLLNRGLS